MKFYLFLVVLVFSFSNVEAAIVARIKSSFYSSDNSKKTHLIVAGTGNEGFNIFQQAAIAKGLNYSRMYPDHDVIIVMNTEVGLQENLAWLKNRKVEIEESSAAPLTFTYLLEIASYFRNIVSLDIFSHSAIKYGIQLSVGPDGNIFPDDKKRIKKFKSYLNKKAYIVLHGCNSGFYLAPLFSDLLGVPVFGSLTSTDFQEKTATGDWYFNNSYDLPENVEMDKSEECKLGLCIRMKPRNAPYVGYWGKFTGGGLSFYKVFCVNMPNERCLEGMAMYTRDFISSYNVKKNISYEEYQKVVQEMICPIHARSEIRQECIDGLNQALKQPAIRTYSPFRGQALSCGWEECLFDFVSAPTEKSPSAIELINTSNKESITFVEEYFRYLHAYKYMKTLN
jgi:hypothetical protein